MKVTPMVPRDIDGTVSKFPRYTVMENKGRHRHGSCWLLLVANMSG